MTQRHRPIAGAAAATEDGMARGQQHETADRRKPGGQNLVWKDERVSPRRLSRPHPGMEPCHAGSRHAQGIAPRARGRDPVSENLEIQMGGAVLLAPEKLEAKMVRRRVRLLLRAERAICVGA